jgi:predicted RND superfamily exporter protein
LKNLEKLSKRVILGLGLVSIACIFSITFIEFDYDFESFFPQGDPETEFYKDFRDKFETDNDFIVVALENEKGIFQKDFLLRADSLTEELKKLPNVEEVISPTQIKEPIKTAFGFIQAPLMRIDNPEVYSYDSLKIFERPELVGSLFSKNGKAIMLQVIHTKFLSKQLCDSLSHDVTDLIAEYSFNESHAVGRAIGQVYYIGLMQRETITFVVLSVILIIVFLFIAFRSWWGIWVPITVVLLAIVWVLGLMQVTGKEIDLMVMILPTILFVVGMSDVVHILSKYFDELRLGTEKIPALKIAFKEIGLATLLTSITTAIGFLTLLTASIDPICDFGLYSATGVILAFILAYTLLPAVLVLTPAPKVNNNVYSSTFWTKHLHRAFGFLLRNKGTVIVLSIILVIVSSMGMSKITVNNFLLEDLSDSDPFKQEFDYFEDAFAGARPFEMALEFKENASPWELQSLLYQEKLDDYLKNTYGAGNLMSPVAIVKGANRSLNGGKKEFYKIPEDEAGLKKITKNLGKFGSDKFIALFYYDELESLHDIYKDSSDIDSTLFEGSKKKWGRINGKVPDLGSTIFFEKEDSLNIFLASELDNPYFDARITGTARLIDLNNRTLATNMLGGLAIAFAVIALIVGFMFKSIKMIFISLIPNIFPLLMIAGVMGWSGIGLKVSTSIIFTIAFGIAVDDTIHFLTKLRLELAKGKSLPYAIKRTFIGTGKAIIVTSLILCGGFLTLIGSDFLSVFYIGLLISITLLMAVLADLFLLPLLIFWFYGKSHKKIQS